MEWDRRRSSQLWLTAVVAAIAVAVVAVAVVGLVAAWGQSASSVVAPGVGRSAAQKPVSTYPGPGWRYASPETTITIDGAAPEALAGMRVTGSRSGKHAGMLRALRLGPGAVFDPEQDFQPDERVTVKLPVPVRDATDGSFTFRVAGSSPKEPISMAAPAGPLVSLRRLRACRLKRQRLRTLPGHRPVGTCMHRRRSRRSLEGRILLSPRPPNGSKNRDFALMILTNGGRLLWHSPHRTVVHDLKPIRLDGEPHLAYYVRHYRTPTYYEIVNQRYEVVKRVYAGNGFRVNAHDMQVTKRETAYLAIYKHVRVPGTGERVTDFVIQEVDLKTGDVLFEWHALDHVPPRASYTPRPRDGTSWDYFHGNSIELPRPGSQTIVVSARRTSAIYGISRRTGAVRWILGGKQDQFGIVRRHPGWQFCAQHDARWLPDGDLSLFDNGGSNLGSRSCPIHAARVLRFRLDTARRRARLVGSISSRPSSDDGLGFIPTAVGSARRLPSGDTLVNWGTTGRVTQVTPKGRVKWKLQLERWSYRALRSSWTGMPRGRPALWARRRGEQAVVLRASWNGATRIRRWRVLVGPTPPTLRSTERSFRFADLETRMHVRTRATHVAVEALDGRGKVLGRSDPVPVG